jgi:hypothetical protein
MTRRTAMTILAALLAAQLQAGGVNLPVPYIAQPDNQTCLPSCLTMALHFMGRVDLTTQTILKFQPRTNYDRYNLPGILADYGLYGLPSWYELGWTKETIQHELQLGRPVILGCNQGAYGHFVLAVGYTDDGRLIVNDPSKKAPGYALGGDHKTVDWEKVLWRGGCIIRPEPFPEAPPVSGKLVQTTCTRRMVPGETADAEIAIRNTGRGPWPEQVWLAPIQPMAPLSGTTVPKEQVSPFYTAGSWVSPLRVAVPDKKSLATSDTAYFRFKIKAPQALKATTYKQHFNLVDGNGRWFSDSWLAGPGDWEVFLKVIVAPKQEWALPLIETAADGKPALPWNVKFGALESDTQTTAPPEKQPVLRLFTPGRTHDTAWMGDPAWSDYRVEAWVYCEMKADKESDGFERYGIFVRDNGEHDGDTKNMTELGESYAMAFDSDDGSLRAGHITNGAIEDLRKGPRHHIKETGWHKFAIRCKGDELTYELDGQEFWKGTNRSYKAGEFGVYYRNMFASQQNASGIRFAGFKAEK